MKKLLVLFALSACAVTNETTAAKVELDASVARSQASALTAAVTAAQASDGSGIADAVARVGDLAAALVPETKGGARDHALHASSTCSCPSGATTCTLSKCTIGDATVSGTVSWTEGVIACSNLTVDASTAHVDVTCSLTYATGEIAGTLHTTGNATVQGTSYTWDATLTAKAVTFTSTALTGGTLDVTATGTADDKSYSASATVSLP